MSKKNRDSSKKQRQLIGMACSHFGIGKEDKKAMLLERYGESSASDLNYSQAEEMIDDFVRQGFIIKSEKRPYMSRRRPLPGGNKRRSGNLTALASPAELSKIDALAGLISWRVRNGMERWMKKRYGLNKIKTSHDAFVVIEGLKGMFENQMKKRYGLDWWKREHQDVEVCYYITQYFPCMVGGVEVPAYTRIRQMEQTGSARAAV